MSVQYAPSKLKVPAGFQNLLEGLAREVLRDQPDEILKFAAEYFKNQLARRDNTGRDDAVKGDYMEKLAKGENAEVPPQHATPPSDITRDAGTGLILPEKTAEDAAAEEKPQAEEEVDIDLTDPEVEKAAKKIQGVFRKKPSKATVKSPTPPPAAEPIVETTQDPAPEEPAPASTESDSSELTEDEAAAKIQALARGKKARDDVQAIRDSKTDVAEPAGETEVPAEAPADATKEPTEEEKENAAIMIQSAARMKLAKDEVGKIKAEKTEKEEAAEPATEDPPAAGLTEEQAAVKIQSVARMKAAKEEVEQLKQQQASDKEDALPAEAEVAEAPAASEPTAEEIDAAAIKIQASFRGHQARESIKAMKEGAAVEGEAVSEGDSAPVEHNAAPAAETETETEVVETVVTAGEVPTEAEAAPVAEDAPSAAEDTPAATEAEDPVAES